MTIKYCLLANFFRTIVTLTTMACTAMVRMANADLFNIETFLSSFPFSISSFLFRRDRREVVSVLLYAHSLFYVSPCPIHILIVHIDQLSQKIE